MTVRHAELTVDWLGYATARLEARDGTVVYVDPGRYGVLDEYDARDGDLVCVTHDHHYDSDGIDRVASDGATVLVYEDVTPERIDRDVAAVEDLDHEVIRPSERENLTVAGVEVQTLPAYNFPDGPNLRSNGEPVHPRGFGAGYHLTIDGTAVFWPGDTDVLDFHDELDVDVFLPPIGRNFTMNRHEAADLAAALDPELVVPIHYDTFPALEANSGAFAADVAARGVPVAVDEV